MSKLIHIALFLLMMQPIGSTITASANILPVTSGIADNKKKQIEAFMRQARNYIQKGDYVSAIGKLEKVLELDETYEEALTLMAECEEKIEQQRAVEKSALDAAINAESVQALRDFIEQYPKSEYVGQAENCIAEFELWIETRQKNTKDAYQEYLSKSTILGYQDEANDAIRAFEAEGAWNACHNSNSIEKLESYLDTYSGLSHEKEARYELNLLYAEKYYRLHRNNDALSYFKKANDTHVLTGEYLKHYNELQLEDQFNKLKDSNNIGELQNFLKRIPTDSHYYDPISNRIAVVRAQNLTVNSSEMDMDIALNFAKDDVTISQVKERISAVKKLQREMNRAIRKSKREEEKGQFFVTLDFAYETQNTSYGFGLGQVKNLGWFISASTNFFPAEDETRFSLMGGTMLRIAGPLYFRAGAGIGRNFDLRNNDYMVQNDMSEINVINGIDLSAGLQLDLKGWDITADVVTTNFQTIELKIGLDWKIVGCVLLGIVASGLLNH